MQVEDYKGENGKYLGKYDSGIRGKEYTGVRWRQPLDPIPCRCEMEATPRPYTL